jgi:type II secretion system protein J
MKARRGFTMIEFLLAGVLLAGVLLAMGVAIQQVAKSRNTTRARIDAHLRADAAMRMIRRDLVSLLRRDDLYYTRVLLEDSATNYDGMEVNRDEIIVFNNRLQATRNIRYNGDGLEFETHYRIEDDDLGPVLWQRRDPMPDAYPRGGGIITPVVEGILGLQIEAWNGINWFEQWDSDEEGLPWAFRLTVTASGAAAGQSPADHPIAILRTVVPIDRSQMPIEIADAVLTEEIIDRFGLDTELYDDVLDAVATATPPPIPRGGAPLPDGESLDTGSTGTGTGGGVGPGGTSIETPAGTVIIGPDGGSATLQGGGSGGPGAGSRGGGGR